VIPKGSGPQYLLEKVNELLSPANPRKSYENG